MHEVFHKRLLDRAVSDGSEIARLLDGAAVYVTGASGFLAANLLIFLHSLRQQFQIELRIAASARRPPDQIPLFDFMRVVPYDSWDVAPVETTIIPRDYRWIVVHAASFGAPADFLREPKATFSANTAGLSNLFDSSTPRNCERVVYFSSAEIYGQPSEEHIPTPEDYGGGPDLSDPRSIYGESKRMGEVLGATLAIQKAIPFTVLRPWNIYGPGQRRNDGRVPMEFFRQLREEGRISLLSNGSPRRSFCHVWESMLQITACLRSAENDPLTFNVGRQGDEISILDLARQCAGICGKSAEAITVAKGTGAAGLQRCQPDTSRIRQRMPNSVQGIPLPEGLQTCREWMDFLFSPKCTC